MSKTKSLVPDEVNAFDELDYTGAESSVRNTYESGSNDGATVGV